MAHIQSDNADRSEMPDSKTQPRVLYLTQVGTAHTPL